MGNSQPKYSFSFEDALQTLGREKWMFAKSRLSQGGEFKTIDFATFLAIVQSRFPMIHEDLIACLYRGLAGDLQQKMDLDAFLSSVALFFLPHNTRRDDGGERERDNATQQLRLLFRVYEQDGEIPLTRLDKFLVLLYGREALESTHRKIMQRTIDVLYGRVTPRTVSVKEFEAYSGPREMLLRWIVTLLGVFFEPLPPAMLQLHQHYSAHVDADDVKDRFHCSDTAYAALQRVYLSQCAESTDWSLSLPRWLSLTTPFSLSPPLAVLVFEAFSVSLSLSGQRRRWKFPEFLSFVLMFSVSLSPQTEVSLSASLSPTPMGESVSRQRRREREIADALRERERQREIVCEELVSDALQLGMRLYDIQFKDEKYANVGREQYLRDTIVLFVYALSLSTESPSLTALSQRFVWEGALCGSDTTDKDVVASRRVVGLSLTDLYEEIERDSSVDACVKTLLRDTWPAQCESSHRHTVDVTPLAEQGVSVLLSLLTQRALPGLRDLALTACTQFAAPPPSPLEEKEMITELTMRYMHQHGCDASLSRPFGVPRTQWSLLSKAWLERWKRHVGRHRTQYSTPYNTPSHSVRESSMVLSHRTLPSQQREKEKDTERDRERESDWPGPVDTSSLLLPSPPSTSSVGNGSGMGRTNALALRPGLLLGRDFEAVPPPTARALCGWYGMAGPEVLRETVTTKSLHNVTPTESEQAIEDGLHTNTENEPTEVEFYPLSLRVFTIDNQGRVSSSSRELLLSRSLSLSHALTELASERGLTSAASLRLWDTLSPTEHSLPLSPSRPLRELCDGVVLLERERDGRWPLETLWEREKNKTEEEANTDKSVVTSVKRNSGLVGLDNLGNTCYLNASLQCLLHLELLTQYFLDPAQHWREDLNPRNPYGTRGRLALSFSRLTHTLWTTQDASLSPRDVLHEMAAAREQYRGHEQHDAHELLGELLDMLHEDLNRVIDKPYLQQPDSQPTAEEVLSEEEDEEVQAHTPQGVLNDEQHGKEEIDSNSIHSSVSDPKTPVMGNNTPNDALSPYTSNHDNSHTKPEKVEKISRKAAKAAARALRQQERVFAEERALSREWWSNCLRRDNSAITALFQGQYRSVTSCEVCGHSSARYEPFLSLSLPIPEERERCVSVCVLPRRLSHSVRCVVRVDKTGRVRDVCEAVRRMRVGREDEETKEGCVEEEQHFIVCEITPAGRVRRFVSQERLLDSVRESEQIALIEVEFSPSLVQRAPSLNAVTQDNSEKEKESESEAPVREKESESERYKDVSLFPIRCVLKGNTSPLVRVAFIQRRAVLYDHTSPSHNMRGYAQFRLTGLGVPMLDVIPSVVTGAALYECVAHRLREFLTDDVLTLLAHSSLSQREECESVSDENNHTTRTHNASLTQSLSLSRSPCKSSLVRLRERERDRERESERETLVRTHAAPADTLQEVRPCTTEEVVAGALPFRGFTLRLVASTSSAVPANTTNTSSVMSNSTSSVVSERCSRCVGALSECEGCVVPDSLSVSLSLRDGESVAIDWHAALVEELLRNNAAFRGLSGGTHALPAHASCARERERGAQRRVPLRSCFAKFVERETLEDVVCPRCATAGRGDGSLSRNISLYRCPPVLVVNLKRFQFDRISRKKLTQFVDFPRNSLDLTEFLAPSARPTNTQPNHTSTPSNFGCQDEDGASKTEHNGDIGGFSGFSCSEYALASVIHHEGALGGGHYVASLRTSALPRRCADAHCERERQTERDGENGSESVSETHRETEREVDVRARCVGGSAALSSSSRCESALCDGEEQWTLYNDNAVSPHGAAEEVCASSAYVLFYVRKDCATRTVNELFAPSERETEREGEREGQGEGEGELSLNTQQEVQHTPQPTQQAHTTLSHNTQTHKTQSGATQRKAPHIVTTQPVDTPLTATSSVAHTENTSSAVEDEPLLRLPRFFGGAKDQKWFSMA